MEREIIEPDLLKRLVSKGQMLLLEEQGKTIKAIECAEMIESTMDDIWDVITDFGNYTKFLPGVHSSKIISKNGDEIIAKFEVGLKFMGIGGSVKYSTKYKMNKPLLEMFDPNTNRFTSYWEIIDIGEKSKFILFYKSEVQDVKNLHPVLRFFIKNIPPVELAFHVAPVSMLLKAMKKKIEK